MLESEVKGLFLRSVMVKVGNYHKVNLYFWPSLSHLLNKEIILDSL